MFIGPLTCKVLCEGNGAFWNKTIASVFCSPIVRQHLRAKKSTTNFNCFSTILIRFTQAVFLISNKENENYIDYENKNEYDYHSRTNPQMPSFDIILHQDVETFYNKHLKQIYTVSREVGYVCKREDHYFPSELLCSKHKASRAAVLFYHIFYKFLNQKRNIWSCVWACIVPYLS